ncbi:MAG: asparaginase [Brevinema sp.]
MDVALVKEYRNSILECTHYGAICGVDKSGIKYRLGNIEDYYFFRSASKPIQMLPVLYYGIAQKYNLTPEEIAIMSGSQRCEERHVEVVLSILQKTGIEENILIMLPSYPLNENHKNKLISQGKPKRKIYHNCIGKHIALVLLARELKENESDYWKPESKTQQVVKEFVAKVSGIEISKIKMGTDGCGVPVFSVPMEYISKSFLNLANPENLSDKKLTEVIKLNTGYINQYPQMISANNSICTILNTDSNIIAKGGALGVYCFGLKNEGLAFTIKLSDGSYDELGNIVIKILEHLKYPSSKTIENLQKIFPLEIRNDNNIVVGEKEITIDTLFPKEK